MAVRRASGAHDQQVAARRVAPNHHFRLALNEMAMQPAPVMTLERERDLKETTDAAFH
jgi:hypothetical protein